MSEESRVRLAALLACHNRREKTLACLGALAAQVLPARMSLDVFLVDDGSEDGTSEAVADAFPLVKILRGDGSLFWCGGMRFAWKEARATAPDGYLLINDDTRIRPDAVARLLEMTPCPEGRAIAVGSICHPGESTATYGGVRRGSGVVAPGGRVESCDTFNANLVLVPETVCREIGIFHEAYTHGMGDYDYGFEAGRHGIPVLASGDFLGECPRNGIEGTWRDSSLRRSVRWRKLRSPKGLPLREWMVYNYRNEGWKWPWKTLSPYLRVAAGI